MPLKDADVVSQLRAAGARILGKTVTTELAVYQLGKTSNPHDPARTPGGSWVGNRGGRADGAAGRWHADQRVGDSARVLLRGLRLQAELTPDVRARRTAPFLAVHSATALWHIAMPVAGAVHSINSGHSSAFSA